jgi:hypothetical protein
MKFGILVTLLVTLLAIPAFADNLLINGGFEQSGSAGPTDFGPGWVGTTGPADFGPGWVGYGAELTEASFWPQAHTGNESIGAYTYWNGIFPTNTGSVTQTVELSPGRYTITLNGWGWIFNGGGVLGILRVDGNSVADQLLSTTNYWDPRGQVWLPVALSWTGQVNQSVTTEVALSTARPYANAWEVALSDDWDLEANPVPEPSGLIALIGGLATLAKLKGRKRG